VRTTRRSKSTTFFIKQYAKDKKEADKVADAHFSLVTIYEKESGPEAEDKIIAHLRSYLKTHAKAGGYDRGSSPGSRSARSCGGSRARSDPGRWLLRQVTRQRATAVRRPARRRARRRTPARSCHVRPRVESLVVQGATRAPQQGPGRVRAAADWSRRRARWTDRRRGGREGGRKLRALESYAAAKFHLVRPYYEKFLTLEFPKGLDFGNGDADDKQAKKEEAVKRFKWISAKGKLMSGHGPPGGRCGQKDNKPVGAYRRILSIPNSADWAIASSARIRQIAQNFSDALFTAEIPAVVRTGEFAEDKVDAYCDQLMTEADPLENLSVGAYSFCLDVSTRNNWFNSWSKLCERELGQIRPAEFPTATEVHEQAVEAAPITDIEPAVSRLAE
jgi:hypothetical protein